MSEQIQPPSPPITDGVVALRPFRADDAPAIMAACQDPEIQRWVPLIPVPYTEADARRFILMTLQAWHDGSGYEFAIADPATDRYIGSIGLHVGANPRRHALGYLVAPQSRRRGVAVRAVRLVVKWAFEKLEVERLALWTLPGNIASQAVAEKAGFRREGLIRNWEADRDEHPVDAVMFSMTPDDLADMEAIDASDGAPRIARLPRGLRAPGSSTAPFFDLLAAGELTPGTMRRVTLAELDLLVAWTADGIVVTADRCPHMAAPLSIGVLDGCVAACPLHEGRYDLCSGETVQMPTTGGLDADGEYHSPWSPGAAGTQAVAPSPVVETKLEPPSKKAEARRLTRVGRIRHYPARIRNGRLEAQLPIVPE
jgi:RimJ/RimL family protein N-acetyltransferase/nitrite reductase/ring-hydroxylating ferredoxin subunit